MSSKRIVASCAVMALAVIAGAWYAVGAFPLRDQGTAAAAGAQWGPGPLESRAHPVTPENPIPRRISHVNPEYPQAAGDAGASGTVTVRMTIDESGRVAEVRPVAASWRLENPVMTGSFRETSSAWVGVGEHVEGNLPPADRARVRNVVEAFVRAATDAVKQWQYDPPFNAPISFNVSMSFGDVPPLPPPPPPPPARLAERPGAPPPPPPPPPETAVRGGVPGGVGKGVGSGVGGGAGRGVGSGAGGGVPGGVVGGAKEPPPPPPPPPRSDQQTSADAYEPAIRVGGNMPPPRKIKDVRPVYPEEARAQGIQGVVIIEARIEPDGTVSEARVLRSIPALDQAAVDAVMQWQFVPPLMNGKPVPVIMTVTVNFVL